MYFIFFEVDSVLNSRFTKETFQNKTALDPFNVDVFCEMVSKMSERYGNVRLILSASWRADYNCYGEYDDSYQKYLEETLLTRGIMLNGVTPHLAGRAFEIVSYLSDYRDKLDGYVVLADKDYGDMKTYLCSKHWVQTSDHPRNGKGGLHHRHIRQALRVMEKPLSVKERMVLDYVHSLAK